MLFGALDDGITTVDGNDEPIGDEIAIEKGVTVEIAAIDPLVISIK